MKLYNAGTLTIEGRTYSIKDNTGVFPIEKLVGENTNVWGGRVTRYGRAKDNPNYIMLMELKEDRLVVIDIAVEDVSHFPREVLKALAKRKKKKFASNILDEDLIKLVK